LHRTLPFGQGLMETHQEPASARPSWPGCSVGGGQAGPGARKLPLAHGRGSTRAGGDKSGCDEF
jgi:hypothetical protein